MRMELFVHDTNTYLQDSKSFTIGVGIYSREERKIFENFHIRRVVLYEGDKVIAGSSVGCVLSAHRNEVTISQTNPLFRVIDVYKYLSISGVDLDIKVGDYELLVEIEVNTKNINNEKIESLMLYDKKEVHIISGEEI